MGFNEMSSKVVVVVLRWSQATGSIASISPTPPNHHVVWLGRLRLRMGGMWLHHQSRCQESKAMVGSVAVVCVAYMLAHVEIGNVRGNVVKIKHSEKQVPQPGYNPVDPIMDNHCLFACVLRAYGISHPALKEVQILRALAARLWRCFPQHLAQTAQVWIRP